MTVVISGSTGSTYDVGTRLIVKYMSRYIPGQPQIVPKSMIGAGHLIATNYLYNAAERDGSVIGSIGETVPMAHLLTPQQAKFKAGEFFWLGNPAVTNTTIITWHTTGIRTLARRDEARGGARRLRRRLAVLAGAADPQQCARHQIQDHQRLSGDRHRRRDGARRGRGARRHFVRRG